ncbi:MAG: LysM peptidoglycan-binding domain-containing protein [Nanoarchaeota archaeon]|nr:LysM peptidoglycan-binding domain-containing protein [Nanoarchaeota archaeon]
MVTKYSERKTMIKKKTKPNHDLKNWFKGTLLVGAVPLAVFAADRLFAKPSQLETRVQVAQPAEVNDVDTPTYAIPDFNASEPNVADVNEPKDTEARVDEPNGLFYIVQRGDNLWNIAKKHKVSLSDLKQANQGINYDKLEVGQRVILPEAKKAAETGSEKGKDKSKIEEIIKQGFYIIEDGDTLTGLAKELNIPYTRLRLGNYDINPNKLRTGQKIEIPNKAEIVIEKEPGINYKELYKTLIKHEDVRTKVYLDSKEIQTIGVGFNLRKEGAKERIEELGYDYGKVLRGEQEIKRLEAYNLMREDLAMAVLHAKDYMGGSWDGLHEDAKEILVDMAYNMGENLGGIWSLRACLKAGKYEDAARRMETYQWYKETGRRAKGLVAKMKNIEQNPLKT